MMTLSDEIAQTGQTVFVHLGPHKTGSTAIQRMLHQNEGWLADHDIGLVSGDAAHSAAVALARKEFELAEDTLSRLNERIMDAPFSKFILSQEDFSGDLFGRGRSRKVYPTLTRNLRILTRAFSPNRVQFLFFHRPEDAWLKSCYAQHLRYRAKFNSYDDFQNHLLNPLDWQALLAKPKEFAGERLHVEDYREDPHAGIQDLLRFVLGPGGTWEGFRFSEGRVNSSQPSDVLREYERINQLAAIRPLVPTYKARRLAALQYNSNSPAIEVLEPRFPDWPPATNNDPTGLSALQKRVGERVWSQPDAEDVLPNASCDLRQMATNILDKEISLPELERHDFRDQAEILRYHLRGNSELAWLNSLTISYLRRDTPHTVKARHLFQRIWREHGHDLTYELSTRWLISTLQTFADHGSDEHQRSIGIGGYFYANMLKIYEGERAIEGRAADAIYESPTPETENGFRGLDRFQVGNTDLLLNTNALLLELAGRDSTSGQVLEELLLRVKVSKTVFSRMDQSRIAHDIEVQNFSDTWSFFEKPR